MTKDIHRRVLETIARHAMIRPGDRIGIGVSGGADSTAMLRIFADLRAPLGIAVVALHFHHQLRGADADEDERFVQVLAAKFGMESETGRADVAGEAKRRGWNLEDAARRLRYQFFASAASARDLNRVAVAHTADDQAETVLSHLLRGTGLTGLAGIYPAAGLIIRPLLDLRREELRAFLSEAGQTWREDATNQDTSRMRARIRHQLIPLLHRDFDPAVVTRLARFAAHAREDEVFWRALEDERLSALAIHESSREISVSIADLLSPLPQLASSKRSVSGESALASAPALVLTRRLVRRIFSELRGRREQLTARHVESVLDLATKSQSGARIELPGVCVERIFDRLSFTKLSGADEVLKESQSKIPKQEFAYQIPNPGRAQSASVVVTEIQRRFKLKVVDWPPGPSDTGVGRGALDFDCVRWPLVLRNWRPGDSYRPHGSQRVRKLKRLLLESRVPRKAREGWPVLTSEDQVIWASGFPAAEALAPREGTQTGLVISEEEL
ncbi:MAG TPA: tRNA lysidine(34) synthetase TilS [Candidatus Acidoferrales bacterium]|nr:tRNA lysidine(34) synthetase TilS [Candidatus Acidoferrales bacterium]